MLDSNIIADLSRAVREGRTIATYGAKVVPDTVFSNSSDLQEIINKSRDGVIHAPIGENRTWSVVEPTEPFQDYSTTLGHWAFNENTGTEAVDSSVNHNDLTLTNPTWASGKFGYCVDFNGSSSKGQTTVNSVEGIVSAMYVAGWINPDSISGVDPVVTLAGTFKLYLDGGVLKLDITDGSTETVNSGLTVATGSWQHIGFQYNAGVVHIWVGDIVHKETIAITSWTSPGDTLQVGTDGSNYYDGKIDEVIIEPDVRIEDDWPVVNLISSSKDYAFWCFAEGSGVYVHDASMFGPSLVLNGGTWTDGYRREAVSFNGSSDYGVLAAPSATSFTDILTIEVGIRFDTDAACPIISQTDGLNLRYDGSGHIISALGGVTNSTSTLGELTVDTDNWYNVAVVYDGVNKECWINGQKYGQVESTGTAMVTANPLYIARNVAGNEFGDCTITLIRIYKGRLKPYYRWVDYYQPGIHGFGIEEWMVP